VAGGCPLGPTGARRGGLVPLERVVGAEPGLVVACREADGIPGVAVEVTIVLGCQAQQRRPVATPERRGGRWYLRRRNEAARVADREMSGEERLGDVQGMWGALGVADHAVDGIVSE